jgi:hypothetical protein
VVINLHANKICNEFKDVLKCYKIKKIDCFLRHFNMVILDCLACTIHFVKPIVTLFLTFVFHFNFVPHTPVIVYFKFYCMHINIFVAFGYVLLLSI